MTPSQSKLNIFALPNQTTVLFLLILGVVLLTVLAGSVGSSLAIKSLAIALLALPVRAFFARPERQFARYRLRFAHTDFPEIQREVERLANKIGLRRAPRIAVAAARPFPRWGLLRQGQILVSQAGNQETPPAEPVKFTLLAALWGWYGVLGAGDVEDVRESLAHVYKLWGTWYLAVGRQRKQDWQVRPRVNLHIFGSLRRWYLALSQEEAESLHAMLSDPQQAAAARALLIHELYHFRTGDYWQLGYIGEVLRLTFLVMLWAAAFFMGLGLLLIKAKPVILQLTQFAPMLKQTIMMFGLVPKELSGVFQQSIQFIEALVALLQRVNRDFAHLDFSKIVLFSFGGVYPYVILGPALWLIYWPKLWRTREFYADAGVAHEQRTTRPYQAALLEIPLPYLTPLAIDAVPEPRQPGWRARLKRLWDAVKGVREFHPPVFLRLRAVAAPQQVFGSWRSTAFLVGTLTVLLEVLTLSPLTLIYAGQMPMHFPTLAALALIGLNYLLPALAQGRTVERDLLKMVGALAILRLIIIVMSLLIFVGFWRSFPAQFSAIFETVSSAAARAFRSDQAAISEQITGVFLLKMAVLNLAQVPLVAGVLLVALKLLTFLLRRLWIWYGLPRAERRLMKIAYALIALVTILTGFSILPFLTALLLNQDALINPAYTQIEVFGLLCFVGGLLFVDAADRRYAYRCPSCGRYILDAYAAGSCCPYTTCQYELHPWLSITYDESRSDAS